LLFFLINFLTIIFNAVVDMFRAEKGSKRMELSGVRVECRSVGGFCDLPDLGAISVSRGAISAGWNILKF